MFFFVVWSTTFWQHLNGRLNKHDFFLNGLAYCGNMWVSAVKKTHSYGGEMRRVWFVGRILRIHLDAEGQSWELHCWDLWLPFSLTELGQPLWLASGNQTDQQKTQWWSDGVGRCPGLSIARQPRLIAVIPRAAQARNLSGVGGVGLFERVWVDFNCLCQCH